jgi:molybdenum cofactor biosynthesis protein A
MTNKSPLLTDTFGREHTYLRISLIERCNLRCTYCMPEQGVVLTPRSHLMTYEEIFTLAQLFVKHGVTKIRLTGGEPLIRKDLPIILEKLSSLPVSLTLTTNAVIVDKHMASLKQFGVNSLNVSLDSLDREKFKKITLRDDFDMVYRNIHRLVEEGFRVKLNMVVMKGVNDNEVIDFIKLTQDLPITVRFIEFMPFDGNKWNIDKTVSYAEIMEMAREVYSEAQLMRLQDAPNDTSKNYQIEGYQGSWAVISTITNPFCDSCNRLRLTANGKLKNCLFSQTESDLLTALRAGKNIEPIIQKAVASKLKVRGGMDTPEKLQEPTLHSQNRSMITIGG